MMSNYERKLFKKDFIDTLIKATYKALSKWDQFLNEEPDCIIREDKPQGKTYYMNRFSGCGFVYIKIADKRKRTIKNLLTNHQIKVGERRWIIYKDYHGTYCMYLDGFYYSNGNIGALEKFYDLICSELSEKLNLNCYTVSRLD